MNFIYTATELIIGFVSLFLITKVIGKRQISQITPFDFISAIVLGELLGNAIYDKDIGIIYILCTLALWGILMLIIELLSQKNLKLRSLLEGKPSIVIRNGVIDRKELKQNKININELLNLLRQKDVFSVREVEYAILEADGKISVLKKSKYTQPTGDDFNFPEKPVYLAFTIISDGEVIWENLKACGFSERWLQKQLKNEGFNDVKEVFYAEWKQDEGIYIVPRKDN